MENVMCSHLINIITSTDVSTWTNLLSAVGSCIAAIVAIYALSIWKKQITAENQLSHVTEVRTITTQALIDWTFNLSTAIDLANDLHLKKINENFIDDTNKKINDELQRGFDLQTKNLYAAKEYGMIFLTDDHLREHLCKYLQILINRNVEMKSILNKILVTGASPYSIPELDIQGERKMMHDLIRALAPKSSKI